MADFPELLNADLASKDSALYSHGYWYQTEFTMTASEVRDLDLNTLLGADAAKVDFTTLQADVFQRITDGSSNLFGFYMRRPAYATCGFKPDGSIRVTNPRTSSVTVLLRLSVRLKP